MKTFEKPLKVKPGKLHRKNPWLYSAASLMILYSAAAYAQVDQGSINGTVEDQTGSVVPNALVTLTQPETGFTLTTHSDGKGYYSFSPIKIGTYRVQVSAPGFSSYTQDGLSLNVNQRLEVDPHIAVGASSQNVTVNANATALLQTEQSSTGQVVSARTLNETPLNGRNYVFIAQLTAGVDQSNGTRGEGKGDFNANGQRAEQNNFILDGVDNNSNAVDFLNGATFVVKPPPDALAEFKVQTGSYDAEFGHSAGAVINASIRSGTNAFHGDLWEYFRNDALDARDFDALTIPKYRQNQFGATFGGPILRNKLFFFADGEANRIIFGETSTLTVPTLKMRGGDFSELLNPALTGSPATTLYEPRTGGAAVLTCNGQENVLCTNQINATAQKILNLYPLPNTGNGLTYNNYVVNRNASDDTAQWDGRLDLNLSQQDQAFVRMSYENEPGYRPPPLGPILDGGGFGDTGSIVNKGENFAFSETHIFSPSLSNEARFGYNYGHFSYLQPNFNSDTSAQLGIGGVPFSPLNGGLPNVGVSGISGFGSIYNYPADEHENVYQILDNVTKTIGSQTIRFGVSFQRVRFSTFQPTWPKGTWYYGGTFTGQPGTSFTGSGVADFLTDSQQSNTLSTIATTDDVHWYRSGYVQDDWKLTPALTLNLGLRYDFYQPYYERHDQQANFNVLSTGVGTGTAQYLLPEGARQDTLSPNFLALAAQNHVAIDYTSNRGLADSQNTNFAPRVGFAYSVNPRAVVRGGYGIFYGGLESVGYSPNLGVNYPFTFNSNFNAPSCVLDQACQTNGITLANGYATQLQAGLNNLVSLPAANGTNTHIKTTYSEQFNLSTQYALSNTMSATVGYVGAVTRHLAVQSSTNPSAALAIPGTNTQSLSPFPGFGMGGYFVDYGGIANYNSVQVSVEKRYSSGLYFLGTYTYAHSLDDSPTPLGATGDGGLQNSLLIPFTYDYANSPFDVRQRFTLNGNYQLPLGLGRRYLNHQGLANEAVGGWSLSLVYVAQTGNPFTVTPDISTASGGNARALLTGNPFQAGGSPNTTNSGITCAPSVKNKTNWYNPCAFSNPLPGSDIGTNAAGASNLVTSTAQAIQYLGEGRDQIYGPGYNRLTMSLFKNFSTYREQYLQFRADAFNVLNHPALGQPSAGVTSASGQITAPRTTGAFTPDARFFQLALKYFF